MNERPLKDRSPRAFRLDEAGEPVAGGRLIPPEVDPYELEAAALVATPPAPRRRRLLSWGGVFWSAFGSFVGLGIGLWAVNLVEALLAANPMLGWAAAALAGLAALALAVILLREMWSVRRLGRVEALREDAARYSRKALASVYAQRIDELNAIAADGADDGP